MTIYLDWLSLPKDQFKILMFLLDTKQSTFSIENILNYFMIHKNQTNKDSIITTLNVMKKNETIELEEKEKDVYLATVVVPEGFWMDIDDDWLKINDFKQKNFCVSVDWGTVLKVLFASMFLDRTFKREEISILTGIGVTTISKAIKVIKEDFNNVCYKKVIKIINGVNYKNKGISLLLPAIDFKRKQPEKMCFIIRKQ